MLVHVSSEQILSTSLATNCCGNSNLMERLWFGDLQKLVHLGHSLWRSSEAYHFSDPSEVCDTLVSVEGSSVGVESLAFSDA